MPSVIIDIIKTPLMAELIDPQEHTHVLRVCIHFQQGKIKLLHNQLLVEYSK